MTKCSTKNCYHDTEPGTDKCRRHGNERQRVRRYHLTNQRLQERVQQLTNVDYMASLEEEVALAQTMLEQRLNHAKDDPAAIIDAHEATNRSLETISKLVQVMHKHNLATGEILSKPALHRLMAEIVGDIAGELDAFSEHPAYAEVIDRIDEKITARIEAATNDE